MTPPETLGRGLGRSFALAAIIGMVVFAAIVAVVYYVWELDELCPSGVLEDPPLEILAQVAVAFALALPGGVLLSVLLGRRLTRATTERLDEVIASASRMTGERLDERLPVSPAGDPLDQLAGALNGVLERIEHGVEAQRQFAADASHELRTPLAVISTNLEVARRKAREPAHWERVADDTLAEVQRMTLLVEKLLVLSRAGDAGLHPVRADLRALAAASLERNSRLAQEREVRLELVDGAPAPFELDPEAIAIVLDNLLRNAIDHSPRGETVVVTVAPGGIMTFDDRGPGVPADQRERIFEPFARGGQHATDRAAGPGLGLGLAIVRRIVAGHHGSVTVEDRPGGGARFVVKLPRPGADQS